MLSMINKTELKGIICVILSGLLYGLVGYFGVNALASSSSLSNMLFWRFLISFVFIGILLIPKLPRVMENFSLMLSIFIAGALFYGSSTFAYFAATASIGTGMAMVIFFTYPAMVILCNWLLYKKIIGKKYVLAIALITLGLMLITELRLGVSIQGILLSLGSALGYAFYIIASKKNAQVHPLVAAWLVSAGCCAFALAIAIFKHQFEVPGSSLFWMNSLGLGIFSTALPILLLLQGLKYISSEKAAILGVLEPVFVALMGVLLLGEAFRAIQILGIVMLLTGAVVSLLSQSPRENC